MSAYTPTAATIADLASKNCALYTPAGVKVVTSAAIPLGTITLRCNEGYRFTATDPTMKLRYSGAQTQYPKFTDIPPERNIGSYTVFAASQYVYQDVLVTTEIIPVVVQGEYVLTAADIRINTAANLKLYRNAELATANMVFATTDTFNLVADQDYKITGAGFQDQTTGEYTAFTIASDGLTASFTNTNAVPLSGYGVASAELYPGSYRLTQADINTATAGRAKFYKDGVLAVVGELFKTTDTFTLIPNDGYIFTNVGAYFRNTSNNAVLFFTFNQGRTQATFTNSAGVPLGGLSVTTEAKPQPSHTISQGDLDNFAAAKAKLFVNDIPAALGMEVFKLDVLKATANAGRVFIQNPNQPDGAVTVGYQSLEDGGYVWFFRDDETFKVASVTVSQTGFGTISANTKPEQPEGVKGFNSVYEISDAQLKLVTSSRFVTLPDGGEQVDYGKYILGLIDLPFAIDPEMVIEDQPIMLGPYGTGIPAKYLNSDTIRLSLGEITTPGTKKNFLDYKDTVVMLHLPYSDSIALDLEMVIDQTISLEYLVSLYDGTVILNVKSSKTDDIILTQNIDMNIKIPFANINTYPSRNNAENIKLGGDNGIKTAFIELLRNDSVLESGFFTIPIVDEKPLAGYTGFARVEEINLSSKATSYEKDLIVNKLNEGVIIK